MIDWKRAAVSPDATIFEAMTSIENGELQVAIVVDSDDRLLGVATDGDLRRSIIQGASLDDPVGPAINTSPVVACASESKQTLRDRMVAHQVQQIPILSEEGRVVGIEVMSAMLKPEKRPNPVVLMAGGLGTRLHPLTEDRPKPLIEIGGRPILQTVLEGFRQQGFHTFYLAVNYMSWMIEDYFGDGSKWGVTIKYLREDKRLGTAGALSLLPNTPTHPVLVANGDLLTNLNFTRLLDYHTEQKAKATMGVRQYNMQVPYGVIEISGLTISNIQEKPTERYFVNAGLYVLEPDVLEYIPSNEFYDMPELFDQVLSAGQDVAAFPIQEYWQDIGQPGDLDRAMTDYDAVFCKQSANFAPGDALPSEEISM